MKNKFTALVVLSISFGAFAKCDIPRGEKLTVGCTYKCDFTYKFRLRMAALALGYPLKIVDMRNIASVEESMNAVDAILVPGGADINPEYYYDSITSELRNYTQQNVGLAKLTHESHSRDPFEYEVVKRYSSEENFKDLPLLGICRGMQMMSVAQGIPLYLDIKTELGIPNRIRKFDRVTITDSDSLMRSIYKKNQFKGLELHHQGIRVDYYKEHAAQYPLTKVTSYSNNDLVAESLEYTHRHALGVQYHPEKSFTSVAYPVFNWFLKKGCEYKNTKKVSL